MSLSVTTLENENAIKIVMPECFNFSIHREFRQVYENNPRTMRYVIDLAKTLYLDSSALGMLLQLREATGELDNAIRIINARDNVNEVLQIVNFDKMMQIN
jgi:HptB-dependent secretion and biofilm anti anti-sigma factor